MKKIRIAMYKAKNGHISDKIIDTFSGKQGYSHCEFVVNSTTMIGAHYTGNGVAKFRYNNIYNSDLWDVYELPLPNSKAKQLMHDMIGTEYDTYGVGLHFVGLHYSDKDKVWCSEACAMAINKAIEQDVKNKRKFVADIPTLEMPNDLAKHILRLGGTLIKDDIYINADKLVDSPVIDAYGRIHIEMKEKHVER